MNRWPFQQRQGGKMIDRIAVNSKVHFGKPCVAGTRITVQSVLELLDEGLSFTEIIQNYYPELQVEDIRACLRYAIALVAAEDIHLGAMSASNSCSIRMSMQARHIFLAV